MPFTTLSNHELSTIWQQYCALLQKDMTPAVYNTWILSNPITEIVLPDDFRATITITSPTAFHSTNLKKNLHVQVKNALETVLQRESEIQYQVGDTKKTPEQTSREALGNTFSPVMTPQNHQETPITQSFTTANLQFSQPTPSTQTQSPRVEDLFSESTMMYAAEDRYQLQARAVGLHVDYTFSTFAVSTTNEMAHAAATAVSNRPGQSYNPLFLYGGVGVGKTHLMHAIGHNILRNNQQAKIIYCTGEEFTNDIVHAIQTKKASHFKERYRSADVLLIDDIQFIAGKNAVQEEFFHTFNALTKQFSQIVLTSDRPPHEITLLEDRLRSRFEAGLMIDIQQPSFELRTAIVLVKAKAQMIPITIDLAKIIASKVESARKIEGIITSIRSEVELKHRDLNQELIEDILQVEVETKRPRIKVAPADVIKTVANHYHVKQSSLKGTSRLKTLVTARHIAMYLLKKELSLPLTEIGRWFTMRDHTSVMHAVRKIEKEMVLHDDLRQDVSALQMTLAAISR
ncbi:chromosomal replication initiator protein DnaA [Candidatus Woesebacteria bacterium]|nr:chromosomal replication initiator protein DnaA [Candidatus Woesebacteria bacterium]